MKKIIFFVLISSACFAQLRKDQLSNINTRDIKGHGAYSSYLLGKFMDSLILSLESQRRAAGFIPVGNSSGIAVDVALNGDGTLSSAGALSVIKILGNTIPSNASGVLTNNGSGGLSWGSAGTTYTADETTLHLASTVFSIKSTYPGQSSINTLGTIGTGVWNGTKIGLAYGGTNSDLSATGGSNQFLKQSTVGGNISVGTLAPSEITGLGTGMSSFLGTNFTTNSIPVFDGTQITQDNGNFNFNTTTHRMGIGTTTLNTSLNIDNGGIQIRGTNKIHFSNTLDLSTISSPTSNNMSFATNGTEAIHINSSQALTFNAYTSNGGVLYTNGSGVMSQTGSGVFPTLVYGALGYSDNDIAFSFQKSVNSYFQTIWQNTSAGATASTDLVISSDNGTATTHFTNLGKNSSGFSGTGSLNAPGNSYLTSTTDDLVIGTTTNNALRFVLNGATTDNLIISGTGNITINQPNQSSGWAAGLTFNLGANTAYTATTEFVDLDFKGRTVTWIDGTTATQRFTHFGGNTVNKTTTSAIFTDIYTGFSDKPIAGSGVTFTNTWAWGFGGNIQVKGNILQTAGATAQIGTSDSQALQIISNGTIRTAISNSGSWSFQNSSTSGGNTFVTFTQSVSTSGIPLGLVWIGGAHTNLTTATEITDINYNLSSVMKMADGTVANQRAFRIQGRTYTPQSTALTLTQASTLEVSSPIAGSGTTIGTNLAINCLGNISVAGNVTIGTGISGSRTITTDGTATDVPLTISTKGAGSITLGSVTAPSQFIMNGSGSGVNIPQLGVGTISPARNFEILVNDANSSSIIYDQRLTHTVVTGAIGIGVGMEFAATNGSGVTRIGSTIESVTTNVTSGSELFDILFKTLGGSGLTEKIRIQGNGNVGIGTSSPIASFHNAGSSANKTTTSSASTLTIDKTATIWVFNGTTATWTLPAVSGNTDLWYTIFNIGSGNLTIQRAGSDNLYSGGIVTSVTIPGSGNNFSFFDNGTYWIVKP